ncbi:hypothetical protein JCM10449v2_006449 [Rhodotorula kratochvilovae]
MSDGRTLLHWLLELYSWVTPPSEEPHADPSPRRRARTTLRDKEDLELASSRMHGVWDKLVPFEQEEAVDLLLGAFCRIRYTALCEEIGYFSPEVGYLTLIDAFYEQTQRDRAALRISHVDQVKDWAQSFRGAGGIHARKLIRMGEAVTASVLPSARTVLLEAQISNQSAEDCFHILNLLLESFDRLYDPGSTFNIAPVATKFTEHAMLRQLVAQTLADFPLARFETLAVLHQHHMATHTRTLLFSACKQLVMHGGLPRASQLAVDLFAPLYDVRFHPGGSHHSDTPRAPHHEPSGPPHDQIPIGHPDNPFTLRSNALGHVAQRGMSARTVRRYFGGFGVERQAWEDGGW